MGGFSTSQVAVFGVCYTVTSVCMSATTFILRLWATVTSPMSPWTESKLKMRPRRLHRDMYHITQLTTTGMQRLPCHGQESAVCSAHQAGSTAQHAKLWVLNATAQADQEAGFCKGTDIIPEGGVAGLAPGSGQAAGSSTLGSTEHGHTCRIWSIRVRQSHVRHPTLRALQCHTVYRTPTRKGPESSDHISFQPLAAFE